MTPKEIEDWSGLVHYVPVNKVYKDSELTPVRLVFDSSQPDSNGRSLNSCMGKGSNPLNHFGTVVINFRAAEKVASGDISKMFNCIDVRPQDQHLRRFFARKDGFAGQKPLQEAVICQVNLGETAAGRIATAVKNRCAEENKNICPETAENIKETCFMDDIQVDTKYDKNLDDKIAKAKEILAKGNFRFKKWIKSGQDGEKELGTM